MEGPFQLGWIVDVQNDFMNPQGRLYVRHLADPSDPGALQILPNLAAALDWMRVHCRLLVFTGDWHGLDDPEIDPDSPDPGLGTYPPHCMGRSDDPDEREGAAILETLRPEDPLVLPADADAGMAGTVALQALETGRAVFVQKTRFDVFEGNSGAEAFLEALTHALGQSPRVYVIGVARDVCVTQAVDGLQDRGYQVVAIRDATWGLGLEEEEETLARWARRGEVISLADLQA